VSSALIQKKDDEQEKEKIM